MAPTAERPVFADTNLGTHLAVAVPPDITVGDLKRKLGKEHSTCFPSLGEIKIHALMVKRKLQHYHLPDSMPIRNAFNGMRITWFLFMDISLVEDTGKQSAARPRIMQDSKKKERLGEGEPCELALGTDQKDMDLYVNYLAEYTEERCGRTSPDTCIDHNAVKWERGKCGCNKGQSKPSLLASERSERIIEKNNAGDAYDQTIEDNETRSNVSGKAAPCGSLSEKISITGIISSYFSDFHEVDSHGVNLEYEKANSINNLGENYLKVDRSASNWVASIDIGGSSLEKFENSLEGMKKTNVTKCEMVVSKVQNMCPDSGRENSPIHVSIDDCGAREIDNVKLLEDNATDCINVAGQGTQSFTDGVPRSLPSSFDLHVKTSRKLGRNQVGERLLTAATKLGLSSAKKRSPISMFIADRGKPSIANLTLPIKNNVFDISDGDD